MISIVVPIHNEEPSILPLYDKLTSPRRGGPRFVSRSDRAWADAIAADERSVEQYVHDSITELLRIGVRAEVADKTSHIVGSREPSVRVLVAATALESGVGRCNRRR